MKKYSLNIDDLKKILPKAIFKGSSKNQSFHLELDSRKISKDTLFVAVNGIINDGHEYIEGAISKGANIIVCQILPEQLVEDVSYVVVNDSAIAVGEIAHEFYGKPSDKLSLVGITGTNGKTSIGTMFFGLFTELGYQCGLISTIENKIGLEKTLKSTHTTPDCASIHKLLADMVSEGCQYCFMEVSSHAQVQKRTAGLNFKVGVFTNLSHDHLDYHKNFKNYLEAKRSFFDNLSSDSIALSNKDDKNGKIMLQNSKASKFYYALHKPADFKAKLIEMDFEGMLIDINGKQAWYRLTGKFNALNILSVYGISILLGEDEEEVVRILSSVKGAAGRFDVQKGPENRIGVVDYAHTPDALDKTIDAILEIKGNHERLITVVGCGGDRDIDKRPLMAEIAATKSAKVILTSDNPRSENPDSILKDMQKGVPMQFQKKVLTISDRREAIRTALAISTEGDVILVAGKGHEDYQEIKGVRHPFDDRKILSQEFKTLSQ